MLSIRISVPFHYSLLMCLTNFHPKHADVPLESSFSNLSRNLLVVVSFGDRRRNRAISVIGALGLLVLSGLEQNQTTVTGTKFSLTEDRSSEENSTKPNQTTWIPGWCLQIAWIHSQLLPTSAQMVARNWHQGTAREHLEAISVCLARQLRDRKVTDRSRLTLWRRVVKTSRSCSQQCDICPLYDLGCWLRP